MEADRRIAASRRGSRSWGSSQPPRRIRAYIYTSFLLPILLAYSFSRIRHSHGRLHIREALKLVSPFKGEKEVMAFISNVDTAFKVINPDYSDILHKFVLTRISGKPQVPITHRNLENWKDLRTFLKNTYTEKRTLDFHATQLFGAKQGKNESVSDWIQNIQRLSSKFREAALQDYEVDERTGIVALADKLKYICFVQGISSSRIQTIVRSRN